LKKGVAMVETMKGTEEDKVAVAVRSEALDGVIRRLSITSVLAGLLLLPDDVSAELDFADNAPTASGFIALDGLSNTAYILCHGFEPPVPAGWHVFRMPADRPGVEAMRRVARSLNPISPEAESKWDDWLPANP
jgi:hypothetical protein